MRPSLAVALALTLGALAACGRSQDQKPPAPPAPAPSVVVMVEGFKHDPAFDAQGYYHPAAPVKVGDLSLSHVAMGAPSDFKAWEAGEREAVFGPIMFQFDDEASPIQNNEMGSAAHTVTVRVLPRAYAIDGASVSFGGTDPRLGEVVFNGRFDPAALAAAKQATSDGKTVLTGALRVGQKTFDHVAFTYFVGD